MTSVSTNIVAEKIAPSGNTLIDALLGPTKWKAADGQVLHLTFSFPDSGSTWIDRHTAFAGTFSEERKVATRAAIKAFNEVANLNLTEINDSSTHAGNIRFAYGKGPVGSVYETASGWASYPSPSVDGNTVWLNESFIGLSILPNMDPPKPGESRSWGEGPLLHELGHALGLKHPFEQPITLPADVNTHSYSVLSYTPSPKGLYPSTPMLYDVLALQYLYGANMSTRAGDDVYKFSKLNGYFELKSRTIWDAGGNDTFDASAIDDASVLDLREGHFSSVGATNVGLGGRFANSDYVNNIAIAFNVIIENAIGGKGNDSIVGNQVGNVMSGGAGNDTIIGGGGNDDIDGGIGVDIAAYLGSRSNFKVVKTATGFGVYDDSKVEGADTLKNIETLKFANMSINLGVGEKAKSISAEGVKSIVELYIAYFNRVPDADGMSYWIDQFKAGTSIDQIGKQFYSAAVSPSFTTLTGYSDSMSNGDFLKVIYKNVLGRDTVDQSGFDYWTGALAKPEGTAGAETRGSLIKAILGAAHSFKGKADFGYVADLLDNKFTVGKYFAIEQGINYNTPDETYTKSVAIAAKVTPTDTSAAIALIGVTDVGFTLM